MKKFKYFTLYFIVFFGMSIIGQKFNLVIRGTPIGSYSWAEIWKNLPLIFIISAIFALYANYFMNEINKKQKADILKAKERVEAKEKCHSAANTHECRVCGCYSNTYPWGEDGKSPSYQICSCCGVQFGKEDLTLESIKECREEWISKGGEWFTKNEKPEGWDIKTQMKNVPDGFR